MTLLEGKYLHRHLYCGKACLSPSLSAIAGTMLPFLGTLDGHRSPPLLRVLAAPPSPSSLFSLRLRKEIRTSNDDTLPSRD